MFGGGGISLTNTLKRNKKLLTVTAILIMTVFVVVLNKSYAYFEKSIEGSCVKLEVSEMSYNIKKEIIVPASRTISLDFIVKRVDDNIDKYQLVYSSDDNLEDVVVGYSSQSESKPYGKIDKDIEKEIKIVVKNNGSSDKKIYVDVRGIRILDSLDDIVLNKNEYKIYSELEEVLLYDTILAKVDTKSNIDFSNISSSTNGRGVYKYTEDGKDIYYYRGKVTDNHVIFGGYCFEMIRTTSTGGVKMIYDGIPIDGKCTNTGSSSQIGKSVFNVKCDDNTYVGYMYGSRNQQTYVLTHNNSNDSTIKKYIDNWFSMSNLNNQEYLWKMEDVVYCSDRSIDATYETGLGYGSNKTGYNSRKRIGVDKAPSLECININDRFSVNVLTGNGALTYPVGLITADEFSLAGGVNGIINDDFYLYTGEAYWGISPYYYVDSAYVMVVPIKKYINSNVCDINGVRPVISLSNSVVVDSGDGTEQNPYIVR